MKLELGCGDRPTPGYLHNDVHQLPGVALDFLCPAHEVDLPDGSLTQVLALGVIEHLTYGQAQATFINVARMLEPEGIFLFDVPDLVRWVAYLLDYESGVGAPFTIEHILSTMYGWQRWLGDEHNSGWLESKLDEELDKAGFTDWTLHTLDAFLHLGIQRARFERAEIDAHFYVRAIR